METESERKHRRGSAAGSGCSDDAVAVFREDGHANFTRFHHVLLPTLYGKCASAQHKPNERWNSGLMHFSGLKKYAL